GPQRGDPGELLPDDPQGQVVVALRGQDEAQPREISGTVFPVPGGRALRRDQPLRFQEPQLGDGDVGELPAQVGEHLTDAHQLRIARRYRATDPRCRHEPALRAFVRARPGDEDQPELADLYLVAAG